MVGAKYSLFEALDPLTLGRFWNQRPPRIGNWTPRSFEFKVAPPLVRRPVPIAKGSPATNLMARGLLVGFYTAREKVQHV